MREIDRIECAAKGRTPRQGLAVSLAGSRFALTAKVDGSPHAMFGVWEHSLVSSIGRPWFLGTDAVFDHPRDLLVYGPRVVAFMHGSFRRLENVVSARNVRALAFLKKLGFEVGDEVVVEGGEPFLTFWRGENV